MNKKVFADLVDSMTQMNEIDRGERAPLREIPPRFKRDYAPPEGAPTSAY